MKKRPTILDVARHAGVSKSTVSLVLQKSPAVKDATRLEVERSMAALDYVYNRSAAGLRGKAPGLVGLIINDLRNPFFTEFAATAQMTFGRKGYSTVIANTDEDSAIQDQVIDSMIEHGVSAFLISPAYGDEASIFKRIERASIPTLQVLRQVDKRSDLFPFASMDFASGGALAAQHLIDIGCRKIAFVGGFADRSITLERMAGYNLTTEAAGLEPVFFPGRPSRALGRELAFRISKEHPEIEGAICFSDLVALGMHSGFAEIGIRLGVDFQLIGFDDIEECSLVYPRLSSVRCDIARFAETAATDMLAWIDDGQRPPDMRRASVELVVRQSSAGSSTVAA